MNLSQFIPEIKIHPNIKEPQIGDMFYFRNTPFLIYKIKSYTKDNSFLVSRKDVITGSINKDELIQKLKDKTILFYKQCLEN